MLAYEYADESIVTFGPFRLDLKEGTLIKSGKPLRLSRKVFEVIAYIAERRGSVVTPNELIDAVWKGEAITDSNVAQHICLARRALDDAGKPHRVISTIHGRGYMFAASAQSAPPAVNAPPEQSHDLIAQELYQNGTAFARLGTQAGLRSSLEFFKRAAQVSPNYEPAYSGAAQTHLKVALRCYEQPAAGWERARESATQALLLDSKSAAAHAVMAAVALWRDQDVERAFTELRTAAGVRPDFELVHVLQAQTFLADRRPQRALITTQEGMNWSPGSLVLRTLAALSLFYARDYEQAIHTLEAIVAIEPSAIFARYLLGAAYLFAGNIAGARERLADIVYGRLAPMDECDFNGRQCAISALIYLEARYGNHDSAVRLYHECPSYVVGEFVSPVALAVALAGFGHLTEALQQLREARAASDPRLAFVLLEPYFLHFADQAPFQHFFGRTGTTANAARYVE